MKFFFSVNYILFFPLLVSFPAITIGTLVNCRTDVVNGDRRHLLNLQSTSSSSASSSHNNNKNGDLHKIMSSSCIDQTYTVSLFAASHIALFLEPTNLHDKTSNGFDNHRLDGDSESWCDESLVMHMEYANKVITIAGNDITDEPLLPLLDSISLRTLVDVFQQSETGLKTIDDYDIIDCNCATFVLNMVDKLDIPVDDRIVLYTIERLYKSGKTIKELHKSDKLEILFNDSSTAVTAKEYSDQELIAIFADHYLRKHEDSKNNNIA